jgi:hypothetical protein
VPPFQIAGRDIRSTDIRSLIAIGDLVGAAALLGRPYAVTGQRQAMEAGALADPRRDILSFAMPVALPPPGRYPVRLGPPWTAAEPAGMAGELIVPAEPGWVEVRATTDEDRPLPAGDRLRAMFSD